MSQPVLIAFFLTSFAGISTGIGSAIAFFAKRTNTSFLSLSLGFSTAVMIYMSFANLFASSLQTLANIHGKDDGTLHSTLSFFGGIVLILLIDKLIPHYENPHEMHRVEEMSLKEERKTEIKPQLLRVDVVTALVLAIGISVSVPIYYATGNRKRALWLSFLSGLAEPVGAVIGYLILAPFLNDHVFGVIFGMIAGIMVFISLDELLPAAEEYGKHHHTIYGLVAGMAVMALNLLMLC